MASAVSFAPWYPSSMADDASPCTVSFGDVRQPELRRRLSMVLSSSLSDAPDPRLNWLYRVDFREGCALGRFDAGLGTLEQRAQAGARGARRLPLPFLWVLRTINAAAATEPPRGLSEISARALLTIGGGEVRLNAALIERHADPKRGVEPAPHSLARTLASCVGIRDSARPLSAYRPILPASLLRVIGELPTRTRVGTSWHNERDALSALEQRLQGRFFVPPGATPCSSSDLLRRRLGLLGALAQLEGNALVDAYFEANRETQQNEPDFRAALDAWRSGSMPCAGEGQSRSREQAEREREAATRARIAQARLEFRRRDRTVALAFAVDAVCAAPEASEAWLTLGQMRESAAPGSAALCFSEAICAARGARETVGLVQKQLGLSSEAKLAAYFRAHGDFALAEWLDPGSTLVISSPATVSH